MGVTVNIDEMIACAHRAADKADALVTAGLGARPSHKKGPGDFATDVDLTVERVLREELESTSGISVFGEEDGGVYNSSAVWVIDPIDGTSNFSAGNPLCAVLISLVIDDQPTVAVTSMPLLHRRVTTAPGRGLTINSQAHEPLSNRGGPITLVGFSSVSSPVRSPITTRMRREMLGALADGPLRPRITGSIGVDLAMCAEGVFDGAISFSPFVWDNAAGVAHVREAGGVVTDIYGQPWHPHATGVVAGTEEAHAVIMGTMSSITQ